MNYDEVLHGCTKSEPGAVATGLKRMANVSFFPQIL